MTNRNNNWNNTESWFNGTLSGLSLDNVKNPFSTWSVNPFLTTPFNTTLTALVNNTPNVPTTNAYENSESYVFEMAAPGYTGTSFEVAYTGTSLSVKATAPKSETSNYSYREYNLSSFTREFSLPSNVDTSSAKAKYENGILTIVVPKVSTNSDYRTIKVS